MPLTVKDFTWEETEKMIFITVPLKGVRTNKVDVISTDEYIKVSYPPYLFECFLYGSVNDRSSTAQVGNGAVLFKLFKTEIGKWGQLQSDIIDDKDAMKKKRDEAIVKVQERAKEDEKSKADIKREREKYSLNELMKAEDAERTRIEEEKETERRKATEDLEKWKEEQRQAAEMEKQRLMEERRQAEAEEREKRKQNEKEEKRKTRGKKANIFEDVSGGVPKREVGKITVTHTERVFPTPERESVRPMEDEWLKKQAEARRTIELEDSNLSEEERNPIWLRDKGNEFFKAGNLEAAINAYSHGLRLNNAIPSLYSNRAACHLKNRNFFKCIEDCSKALEQLVPPVPQNAASRCKCHVRRGTAYCQLQLYVEGLLDYEAALKIDPDNSGVREDAEKIRNVIQKETYS